MTNTRPAGMVAVAPTYEWEFTPFFLLRVAGLPTSAVRELRFPRMVAWMDNLAHLERRLQCAAETLLADLENAIGDANEGSQLRGALINLRRDVFNRRPPRDLAAAIDATSAAGPSCRALLEKWLAVHEELRADEGNGRDVFEAELAERRAFLHELAERENLRNGVALTSRTLDRALATYLTGPGARTKRGRRVERSLAEYVFRTACKTSPFSSLTSVAIGHFRSETARGSNGITLDMPSMAVRSFPALNVAILARISAGVLVREELCRDLSVRVTSGWSLHNDRVRYLRRRRSGDPGTEGAAVVETIHEDLFTLPVGTLLADVLAVMELEEVARLQDILERLEQMLGDDPDERKKKDLRRYVSHLLRLGLLVVPELQLDVHSEDPVADYVRGLRRVGAPWADRIAGEMAAIGGSVVKYASADLDDRRRLLVSIRQQVDECYEGVGGSVSSLPRTVLYEDTTVRPVTMTISSRRWAGLLASLRQLAQIVPVFDMNLPRRLVTKGYFQARFGHGGTCTDLAAFAHEFHQDFYDQYLQRARPSMAGGHDRLPRRENPFRMPEVDHIDDARQAVADVVARALSNQVPGTDEVILGDELISEVAPLLPESLSAPSGYSVFAQLAGNGAEQLLVINRVYAGLTLMFSRFARCFAEDDGHRLVSELREWLTAMQPPGAVFAELRGGHDTTNLNLHPAVTAFELVCPGESSARPPGDQIPVAELRIEHVEEEDRIRLYSARLGMEVIPLYLGFLLPVALPEFQQVLLNFSPASMTPIDLWAGVHAPTVQGTIGRYPRLRYKDLVLQRGLWKLHPGCLPGADPARPEHETFRALHQWRTANGIPARAFVVPDTAQAELAVEGQGNDRDADFFKPSYVDFESYFSTKLLLATAKAAQNRVVLTEMLPDLTDAWFRCGDQSFVSEFVVELDRKEGRRS